MHVVKEYPNGVFSWVDLGTTDVEGAKAFYGGLFGWESVDLFYEGNYIYTMLKIDGKDVAGLGPLDAGMQEQGVPPFWTSYVNHRDVDAIAARVEGAGGKVIFPPMDVTDAGRMAIFEDPTGAAFGVWQPRNHIGAQIVNTPNALVWNELQTNDPAAAAQFYGKVFDWSNKVNDNGYYSLAVDGRTQAGMMAIQEAWGPMPPNWSIYFLVEDVSVSAANAEKLGGKVIVPPTPVNGLGRFATLQDPQGAAFSIIEYDVPPDPPPGA